METDCYFPAGVPLSRAGHAARQAEEAGFDAVWLTETRHNPFLASAAALAATEGMRVGTGIAVAFPRSPMVTAQAAWDLAELGRGRFVLGLGTQVKAHVVRRFSGPFDQPVARLREYVDAYGSTRTYRPVFETHGWGEVTSELHALMERGDTDSMTSLITAEMLDTFSVSATWDRLAAALAARYGGLVDRVAPYGTDLRSPETRQRWRQVTADLHHCA